MNIEELLQKKQYAEKTYYQQQEESKNNNIPNVYYEVLKDLKREVDILDELIKIYSNKKSERPNYLEMKLEKVYMWAMSKLSKDDYFNLSDEEIINLSIGLFPNGWGYDSEAYPIEKKIEYLETAIIEDISLIYVEGMQLTKGKETKK